ncbi:MAG TPA: lysylphosphatidylglycerol synthase transmembrane domain-containing protein [Saprospiraceae bacterium]|mgnify:CR=1 FL=1|nr:lysylphosphatidylglycerol synthase transmembrane domain-containing protein [Saprospiraceae bacterium]HMQ81703.1 lysylphosphatidylglycerol synthase transmembrane domain-containing protein [Saprospiraceae bacterium]
MIEPQDFDESSLLSTREQEDVLKSIRVSRIIVPILLGIAAVGYLLWRQFDPEEFAAINWTSHTLFWVSASLIILITKHLAYATRLRVLSEGAFSWRKCIELIFIWEFSSAVSPTSVGGSAVAFFVLAQEKLPTAKTATIVLYTIVLDSLFFVSSLPLLYLFFGTEMIRPNIQRLEDIGGWGFYFLFAYSFMAIYGAIFYYGLFINPQQIRKVLKWVTGMQILNRYQPKAIELGNDMILASQSLKHQNFSFHLRAFVATATAWSCRFLLLNCLIIAFITSMPLDFWTQFELYARLESMFVIIAFSPTPGGAGFIEILFRGFLVDYVSSATYATVISTIWRLFSYYAYLLAGAIIIPNWIRTVVNERRNRKKED